MTEETQEAAELYAEPYRCPASNENEYCKHDIISAFNNGAKWQAERISLMEIELNHTKTLLESCEKALEDRDKQAERMYSEEEVIKLVDGAFHMYASSHRHDAREWLVEQFKKK